MKDILKNIKIVLLSIIISFGVSLVYAWNGPVSAPPNYNTYTPINVSITSQTKTGSLWAGTFLTEGGGYFGSNVGIGVTNPQAKLHIGGTAGVDGIKFPDGTVQTTACPVSAPPGSETFTSSGTFTVPANVRNITVEVVGGGGGGGAGSSTYGRAGCTNSGGGGGGASGYGKETISVLPGETYQVTVGFSGNGGSYAGVCGWGQPGTAGGTSSFGSIISATGGSGGGGATPTISGFCGGGSGAGGGGSGGTSQATINVAGQNGSGGGNGCSSSGGSGGNGQFLGYGNGGRGGGSTTTSGENGSPGSSGVVIVSW